MPVDTNVVLNEKQIWLFSLILQICFLQDFWLIVFWMNIIWLVATVIYYGTILSPTKIKVILIRKKTCRGALKETKNKIIQNQSYYLVSSPHVRIN